jgi:hypothetical protein
LETEYTRVAEAHDYETTGVLMDGVGSSCEDGVIITHKCKECGDEYSQEAYYHVSYEKEYIDLAQYGSVCGGYAIVTGCTCGKRNSVSLDHSLCEFGDKECELWIEDAITKGQYTINGLEYIWNTSILYTCAVTDSEDGACSCKIRYAYYWLKDANSCMAYSYITWQFGYNEETGTYAYEITTSTGVSKVYHNYVDGSTDGHRKYDCPDCGSYYYENYYYDEDGNPTKYEKIISNTLNNGDDKYYEYVEEESVTDDDGDHYVGREYYRYVYADNTEFWYEKIKTEWEYSAPFGNGGREGRLSYTDSEGVAYSEEYAYVWIDRYNDRYEYPIYSYKVEGGLLYKYDYTYSFVDGCIQTEIYTNSEGEKIESIHDLCHPRIYYIIQYPSCTQDGIECSECVICGNQYAFYTIDPRDHSWIEGENQRYYCIDCGLENANGASGDIIMEDLTAAFGNGEYYVVGYYVRSDVEFSYYVSLILADGTEVVIGSGIEFITIDGLRAYAFSKADVDAWASENGYSDYNVRFSFVPVGADGSFDYGITFTSIAPDTITGSTSFVDHMAADEVKYYAIVPAEDGVWTVTVLANDYIYVVLFDEEENALTELYEGEQEVEIEYELKAGETYFLGMCWANAVDGGLITLMFNESPLVAE